MEATCTLLVWGQTGSKGVLEIDGGHLVIFPEQQLGHCSLLHFEMLLGFNFTTG